MIEDWLTALGIKVATFFGGLVGGVLSLRWFDKTTPRARFYIVLGGLSIACFLTEPIVDFFKLSERPGWYGGIGFSLGMFGMALCARIGQTIRDTDFVAALRSWITKGGGGKE